MVTDGDKRASETSAANDVSLCWISSYPRSGNTFLRIVLGGILLGKTRAAFMDVDMPEYTPSRPFSMDNAYRVKTERGDLVLAKTHYFQPPSAAGIAKAYGVYLYRNPLDAFLSGLNYLYINAERFPIFKSYFIRNEPKGVDQIHADKELDHYYNRFFRDDGLAPFRLYSGGWTENFLGWHRAAAASGGSIICRSYDDVVGDTASVVRALLETLGLKVDGKTIDEGIELGRRNTKVNGKFYWKGRSGVHKEYLTSEQISSYFEKNAAVFDEVGVDFRSL